MREGERGERGREGERGGERGREGERETGEIYHPYMYILLHAHPFYVQYVHCTSAKRHTCIILHIHMHMPITAMHITIIITLMHSNIRAATLKRIRVIAAMHTCRHTHTPITTWMWAMVTTMT